MQPNHKQILDGLLNLVSGMGTSEDKHAWSQYQRRDQPLRFNYEELEAMYTENWIAQKIVKVVPEDMTREWRAISDDEMSPEEIRAWEKEEQRLQIPLRCREALMWARLYGGALLVPIFKNAAHLGPLDSPLDIEKIQKGDLQQINIVDARFAYPSTRIDFDPTSPQYMRPETYVLAGTGSTSQSYIRKIGYGIHHTRVIRFDGSPLPRFELVRNRYWGQTILEPVRQAIINADTMSQAVASLMHELNLDILSVNGLSSALAAGQEDAIMQRYQVYQTLKSLYHLVIVDSEEQFQNRTVPFSGIENLIEQFYTIVSGATDIPYTRLVGTAPKGMNATGDGDLRNYYDMIRSKQHSELANPLRTLDQIVYRSLFGTAPSETFNYTFNSLWQEEPESKAKRQKLEADRDAVYVAMGAVSEAIVVKELKEKRTYDNITDEYVKEIERAVEAGEFDAETEDPTAEEGQEGGVDATRSAKA